jgi:hypothetical protein
VAAILALSLGLTVMLILVATMFQIVHNSFPQVALSENATQVLIAGTGGLTGLLGAYIGVRGRSHDEGEQGTESEGQGHRQGDE